MEKIGSIYALICPISKEVKYIGKTSNKLNIRYSGHIAESKYRPIVNIRSKWINELLLDNKKPLIQLINTYKWDDCEFWERFWIGVFNCESNLLNVIYTDKWRQKRGLYNQRK